ncbi:hypothetical protein C8R47DRAFT_731681 [Mycena vitilis]|nr:hypothetical protein C8R47DRAFT_731681 [Mycena vitilis]
MSKNMCRRERRSLPECQPPPAYSPSPSCPEYSATPRSTECILQQSARRSRIPSTGMCIKCVDNVTLVLLGQEDNVEQPRVQPGTRLNGSVRFQHTESIKSVVLKIEGFLETLPLPGAYRYVPLLSITDTLYNKDDDAAICSHSLPFSHVFPAKFRRDGRLHSLPPTCHMTFDNSRNFMRCVYRITITVVSARHRLTSFLTKNDSVSFHLDFRPQMRPAQPLISNPSLLETVKSCPEEWGQHSEILDSSGPSSSPVLDLFVPSIGVFCVHDSIPFHLQLSRAGSSSPVVRVRMLRQVAMDTGARVAKQSLTLGEGTLRRLPSPDINILIWEGEVRCRDPSSVVGTFKCGRALSIADLLVVEIAPVLKSRRPVKAASFCYPIELTTWESLLS